MKKFPVTEIFGPTIQGEGIDQGQPCYFVRFGGCDFRCTWCDTPHAVLPTMVRASKRLTEDEILDALQALPEGPSLVVVSGGNPALHELGPLCERIHEQGMRVAVETQATKYKNWLRMVDRLCLSPKPPSSEMQFIPADFMEYLGKVYSGNGRVFVKLVVFDHADYEWAVNVFKMVRLAKFNVPFYLSAGNDSGKTVGSPDRQDDRTLSQVRNDLMNKYLWLINRTMVDQRLLGEVKVQFQNHVAAWGNKQGV